MKLEWLANALPAQQIPSQHHFRQFQQLLTIRWIEVLLTSLGPEMCSHNISQVLLVIQTSIYCFGVTPTFRPLSYPHPYPSSYCISLMSFSFTSVLDTYRVTWPGQRDFPLFSLLLICRMCCCNVVTRKSLLRHVTWETSGLASSFANYCHLFISYMSWHTSTIVDDSKTRAVGSNRLWELNRWKQWNIMKLYS